MSQVLGLWCVPFAAPVLLIIEIQTLAMTWSSRSILFALIQIILCRWYISRHNTCVKYLYLNGNLIADKGASALAEAITNHPALEVPTPLSTWSILPPTSMPGMRQVRSCRWFWSKLPLMTTDTEDWILQRAYPCCHHHHQWSKHISDTSIIADAARVRRTIVSL